MKKIIKITSFSILLVLMFGLTLSMVSLRTSKESTPKISVAHGPISIVGNAALDAFCAGNGTDGLSWSTAHVIENLEVYYHVFLEWVDRFLIIRNCTIMAPGGEGIALVSCENIRFENCTVQPRSSDGIVFQYSNDIAVVNSTIVSCLHAIRLEWCQRVNMSHNTFYDNTNDGIYQVDTDGCIINNNTFTNNRYGITFNTLSSNNHVFYNCFKNNELGDIDDKGLNNNIHDNDVCPPDEGVGTPGIPGYPLIFVIAFGSIVVAIIAYRTLKNRRRNL
jgi:parallel beta-helix repeat protein